jgi:hypothetical protein
MPCLARHNWPAIAASSQVIFIDSRRGEHRAYAVVARPSAGLAFLSLSILACLLPHENPSSPSTITPSHTLAPWRHVSWRGHRRTLEPLLPNFVVVKHDVGGLSVCAKAYPSCLGVSTSKMSDDVIVGATASP